MAHVRYNQSHPAGAGPEQRIASRLKNSGDAKHADTVVKTGDSARRTFTNIHHAAGHVPVRDVRDKDIRTTAKG